MANPQIPIQHGGNLASLEHDEDVELGLAQKRELDEFAESLGLENEEVEQEIIELDDGSVIINMEDTKGPKEKPKFYANLAEIMDDGTLDQLANDYLDFIDVDREARKQRDKQYEEGLRRTGLGKDAPGGAVFDGASKVVHPVMAEACVDFAASSSKEILPSDGIVKSSIKGNSDREKEEIASRKVNFLNWQLSEQIPEYRDEMEQLLTQLPLGGSQYLKWRYDSEQLRPTCEWIPIDNVLLPYAATNFYTAARATEVQDITEDEFLQRVEQGIYRDIDASYTSDAPLNDQTASKKANDKIEGISEPSKNIDGLRRIYEITCFMRLDDDDETDGKRAPYILTIDESTQKVLALYRNWAAGDEKLEKLDWIVEFKFIPWRGAYAIGLPHLIGGLAAALTGTLRALLDAAHINNSQTMLKLKGGRISGQSDRIEPTQVMEIEGAPGVDDVRKIAMPMPFNPPSSTLMTLLGWLTDAAKGVVSTSEEKIGEATNNMPVGTAQALIEQGAKVFSSIHARLHRSQAKSLKIISRINNWYLDEMDNQSGEEIEVRDFAYSNDVQPVSDPNIFSETQRLAQTQALLELAKTAPEGMFDMRATYSRVLKQLKVPDPEEILPNPQGSVESNPALENVAMTMSKHAAAYPDQDHIAHLQVHLEYAENPAYGNNPVIAPMFIVQAVDHIKQHLMLFYLQSMRGAVAEAAGGKDVLNLHEDSPLDREAQQALALASQLITQDSTRDLAPYLPRIQALMERVQQLQKSQQEQLLNQDPTAQVLLKTQLAETERKSKEFQSKVQTEMQQSQQDYQLKIAKLQQEVTELQAKYTTQTNIDNQRNATDIAMANINNAAKERIAYINAGAQLNQNQARLEHEQNMSAMEAIAAAEGDIRQHGLAIEEQNFNQEVEMVKKQAEMAKENQLSEAEHERQLQQQAFDAQTQSELDNQNHIAAIEEQLIQPQQLPRTGE